MKGKGKSGPGLMGKPTLLRDKSEENYVGQPADNSKGKAGGIKKGGTTSLRLHYIRVISIKKK